MLEVILYFLLSFLFLHFINSFYSYLKKNYTTKKIKCLGQYQNKKYLDILNELKQKRCFEKKQFIQPEIEMETENYISKKDKNQMENSLYHYVKSITT